MNLFIELYRSQDIVPSGLKRGSADALSSYILSGPQQRVRTGSQGFSRITIGYNWLPVPYRGIRARRLEGFRHGYRKTDGRVVTGQAPYLVQASRCQIVLPNLILPSAKPVASNQALPIEQRKQDENDPLTSLVDWICDHLASSLDED
ncbi:hypothetical protein [Azomonas macrocytogenes]|uniref:Uncharacterized protein n=1 Tax=Azomonas macrocytogenes TaxID=69962 RepID=A0A839SXY3_AZOMA|nr:hypothetical protein [Azomonas macrocytogenes]MBB3102221.1 hypothetical protein [Azomonas macrocytogenes]